MFEVGGLGHKGGKWTPTAPRYGEAGGELEEGHRSPASRRELRGSEGRGVEDGHSAPLLPLQRTPSPGITGPDHWVRSLDPITRPDHWRSTVWFPRHLTSDTFPLVFLFARPPVLRWLMVSAALALAVYADLRPSSTTEHPFAVEEIPAHSVVHPDMFEWRAVPIGLLEPILPGDLDGVRIPMELRVGDPLLATAVTGHAPPVPDGWMLVELPMPVDAAAGDIATIVTLTGGAAVDGRVFTSPTPDEYGGAVGAVAVPPDAAAEVARAAAIGEAIVLVGASE